jgi:Protein of unknown function (DUF2934)
MSKTLSGTSPEQARNLDVVKEAPSLGEHNMNDNEQMIREQAYELWDHAGRPDGRSDEFWFAARAEFEREEETGEETSARMFTPHVEPSRHERSAD